MSRHLTEPEAWRVIAEAFFGGAGRLSQRGLCRSADLLSWERAADGITSDTCLTMKRRVRAHMPFFGGYAYTTEPDGYWCDTSREARDARGMAALWLALDAEERP